MQKWAKISGISCIVYTHVAKAFKDNLILFFDVRMYVAFRSLEKNNSITKNNNNNTDDNDGNDNNI